MLGLLAAATILFRLDDPLPRSDAADEKAIATDLRSHPDQRLPLAGLAVRREGRVLSVGTIRLIDEGDCEVPECTRYRLDTRLPSDHVGVRMTRYESSDYWVIGKYGDATAIGAKPFASPSGRFLVVGFRDDMNGQSETDIPNSVAIWRSADMARVRIVDTPILAFDKFVSWHGDGCVEFTGWRTFDTNKPAQHYWLVEEPLDWTLHDSRPTACKD